MNSNFLTKREKGVWRESKYTQWANKKLQPNYFLPKKFLVTGETDFMLTQPPKTSHLSSTVVITNSQLLC